MKQPKTDNWTFTAYDEKDNVIESFVIKDRTQDEANREAMSYVENHSEIEDWSLQLATAESPVPVQPDENELRDKSLKWWVNLGHEQAWTLREKYFPHRPLLTADERLKIYLAEHSSPIPVKDKAPVPVQPEEDDAFEKFRLYSTQKEFEAEAKNMYYALKRMIPLAEVANTFEEEDKWIEEAKAILERITNQ